MAVPVYSRWSLRLVCGICALATFFAFLIFAEDPTWQGFVALGSVAGFTMLIWIVVFSKPGESSKRQKTMLADDRITLRVNKTLLGSMSLLLAIIGFLGAGSIYHDDQSTGGIILSLVISIVIGGVGLTVFVLHMRSTGIIFYADERGIGPGNGTHPMIAWDDLDAIWIDTYKGNRRLYFQAVDREPTKMFALPPKIMVPQFGLSIPLEEVEAAVERLREKYA